MKIRYFDHAATTAVNQDVLQSMIPFFNENYGNASAIYSVGQTSRKALEDARENVANIFGAKPEEIYFTSCGSESDNTAIKGIARANRKKGNHIITSKIEHPAILESCKSLEKEGFEITYLNVDKNGFVDLEELKKEIRPTTILISVMFANNEVGTIQKIEEIGKISKENNVIFHTDAVQAVGSVKIDVDKLNIDAMSLSAHKFYGPKGIGALYVKKSVQFQKYIDGGHQEKNKRAGTENVALVVGLSKALKLAYDNLEKNNNYLISLRDYYIKSVEEKIPYIKVNGDLKERLPNNANISFRFIEGEGLLLNLDLLGICASSGSACTSGSLEPSHVLLAMGLTHELAHGSLRISFGLDNTKEDVDFLIESLCKIVKKLRDMSPLYEDFLNGKYKIN